MERVTFRFNSDSGAEYLYDDVTGNIFPWGSMEEAILKRELAVPLDDSEENLLRSAHGDEITAKTQYCRQWRSQYQAFARPSTSGLPVPTPDQIKPAVWAGCKELILIVTENCNLKCGYCCYASGTYKYHRKPTNRTMSYEQAIKAVDWFMDNVSAQLARNPRKKYGLSFYGGEPLLNIKLIKEVLEYAEKQYPDVFFVVLTTNGTLLTPENVEILKKHSVSVAISIDGPEDEHDRLRVDLLEQGTYKRIIENLSYIKRKHPEYWNNYLMSLSVYDPQSDVEKISQFFDDNKDVVPRCAFVNMVSTNNSEYYNRFKKEDFDLLRKRMIFLRQKYKQLVTSGKEPGSYLNIITGTSLVLMLMRGRVADARDTFVRYTGCCIPGSRMTVNVNGEINMCERVNGTFPIGHLDQGGLNYVRIAQLVQEYQEKILYKCERCPITRLCFMCFSSAEANGGIMEPRGFCESTKNRIHTNLADYVSIMESNPDVELAFKKKSLELLRDRILIES